MPLATWFVVVVFNLHHLNCVRHDSMLQRRFSLGNNEDLTSLNETTRKLTKRARDEIDNVKS